MNFVVVIALVWVAALAGITFGGMLGANRRSELEDENADLRRRLFARYEEHA